MCDCVGACVSVYSHYVDTYIGPKYILKPYIKNENDKK